MGPTKRLKLAVSQSRTRSTLADTLSALEATVKEAGNRGARLVLFPEAYLGGYPRGCSFGAAIGSRTPAGRDQFLAYSRQAIDLGDTPAGAGDDWVEGRLPLPKDGSRRGDGTREELERIARETGVFVVTGIVEKAGGSLYCAVLYVCPREGVLGKRRKVMPTGSERLCWAQGQPSSLKAVATTIDGVRVRMAAAVCWENYMPLLRASLYAQDVNLYLAPTADFRATWLPLMVTVGFESRAFVLSCNQAQRQSQLPDWIHETSKQTGDSLKQISQVSPTRSEDRAAPAAAGSDTLHRRRTSVFSKTEDEHEICWPAQDFNVAPDTNGSVSTASTPAKARRTSVITSTSEKHEICWPCADGETAAPDGTVTVNGDAHALEQPKARMATAAPSKEGNADADDPWVSPGGSCIVGPMGDVLAGPLWEESEELLVVEADFDDCERGRLDLDVAGHYSRSDAFRLSVEGLELAPPP